MDVNARYEQLAAELGHLDSEIGMREERREAIRAEMKALKRLATLINQEAAHAEAPAADVAPAAAAAAAPSRRRGR